MTHDIDFNKQLKLALILALCTENPAHLHAKSQQAFKSNPCGFEEKCKEWIFIEDDTLCNCDKVKCDQDAHRIYEGNLQSDFYYKELNVGSNRLSWF